MTFIQLTTIINAPAEICFNLARSIDAHQATTGHTKEKAIAGRTSGLIENGETVTWQAVHFSIKQKLTVQITDMVYPHYFSDKMLKGAFTSMQHKHIFEEKNGITVMTDEFKYTAPLGILGRLFDRLVLKKYMTNFLLKRNAILKETAESDRWKEFFNI